MIALLLVSNSFALDGALALDVGSRAIGGDPLGSVIATRGVATGGGRLTLNASDHVGLVTGFHVGGAGARVSVPTTDFEAAVRVQELTIGGQFDVDVTDEFSPYLLVEALGLRGAMLLDGDPSRDDNASQVRRAGLTAGGAALLGCDVHARQGDAPYAPAAFLEVGYAWAAPLQFADLGAVPVHGVAARLGVGIRF